MAWISNYSHVKLGYDYSSIPSVNSYLAKPNIEVKVWTSNYILSFNEDVITYPCPNFSGDLANLIDVL